MNTGDRQGGVAPSLHTSLPIVLKWSLSLSALIVLVMGMLAWFLLEKQEQSFNAQSEMLGQTLVSQLASSTAELLVADDRLAIETMLSQLQKNHFVLGMAILDAEGEAVASAGHIPTFQELSSQNFSSLPLKGRETSAPIKVDQTIVYSAPISFQKITAGYALISFDRELFEKEKRVLLNALVMTTLGLILTGVLLSILLAIRLTYPINKLAALGAAIDRGESFDRITTTGGDEIHRVASSIQRLADGVADKEKIETIFSRYVSPSVADQVLSTPESSTPGGSTIEGSVLFCDIVGFTGFSESREPHEVADMLNHYFQYFTLVGASCNGVIDKFIGDCVMILFGTPTVDPKHGLNAVMCAALIQEVAERISHVRIEMGLPTVKFSVGVNSGPMFSGNLGSEDRLQFTVVGDVVNVASRLCSVCAPDQVVISEATLLCEGVESQVLPIRLGRDRLKGRKRHSELYQVSIDSFVEKKVIIDHLNRILPLEAPQG